MGDYDALRKPSLAPDPMDGMAEFKFVGVHKKRGIEVPPAKIVYFSQRSGREQHCRSMYGVAAGGAAFKDKARERPVQERIEKLAQKGHAQAPSGKHRLAGRSVPNPCPDQSRPFPSRHGNEF
jgi:hypothetical protein